MHEAMKHIINQKPNTIDPQSSQNCQLKVLELKSINGILNDQKQEIIKLNDRIPTQETKIITLEAMLNSKMSNQPKTVSKELFPSHQPTKNTKPTKSIPTPKVGNNNMQNDTLTFAKTMTKNRWLYSI